MWLILAMARVLFNQREGLISRSLLCSSLSGAEADILQSAAGKFIQKDGSQEWQNVWQLYIRDGGMTGRIREDVK